MLRPPRIPLPKTWPSSALRAVLHVLASHRLLFALVRARYAKGKRAFEHVSRLGRMNTLRELNELLSTRMRRIPAAKRPHYTAEERFKILKLQAREGWTDEITATTLCISEQTLVQWRKRVDEGGERALVRPSPPINRLPDAVTHAVREIDRASPGLGRRTVAYLLTLAGVAISASTAGRARKAKDEQIEPEPPSGAGTIAGQESAPANKAHGISASYEHHVWHIDWTMLPTLGTWVPWYPLCLPPVYPFFYWLGAVLDQHTRKVVAFRLFLGQPSAKKATALLDLAVRNAGKPCKHIISDRGSQFGGRYREWCRANGVKPRFGAVGKHRSIALIERLWRSLKYEHWFRLATTPWTFLGARREIEIYVDWYHEHRPHQALGGATPNAGRAAEPVEPETLARADPTLRDQRLTGLRVRVEPFKGRKHLPVVSVVH